MATQLYISTAIFVARPRELMAEDGAERTLETTPTWAVASVCFILISISIFTEHFLHRLIKWYFSKRRRKSLNQALENIKSEMMILGFISLMLTVIQKPIANICIPKSVSETFLPCGGITQNDTEEEAKCTEQGKVSFLSRQGVGELQYLIFALAFFHIFSCIFTFTFAMAKMKKWESWEAETRTMEYQFTNDPRRFRLTNQTTFGKRHLRFWSDQPVLRWPACFFRQFGESVYKADYLTLRHGFIMAHFGEGSNFDFQKFIRRALENDFGVVVGISLRIWLYSVIFIFFNANGFLSYLWLPFIPLVLLLLIGTKLQAIITKMCLASHDKSHVIRGAILVEPNDRFFWFGRPKLTLHLLHFILFQNSFQLAFFTWTWAKFGFRSCFHRRREDIIIRLTAGVAVQILCAYVTLPLYALVTQMGTSMKKAVFTEGVVSGLKRWRANAKRNLARRTPYSPPLSLLTSPDSSPDFSRRSDAEYTSVIVSDQENVNENQGGEELKQVNSFQGFSLAHTLSRRSFRRSGNSEIERV